ncbi:MAG: head-tail adaptor protein [Hyphomicrobiales bacterium]|nr:MAG: head-tail adaptor protein [Hyphomicrobiales bacterium]
MPGLDRGSLDKFIRIERPVSDDAFDGAGSGEWVLVAQVWANVQDILPSHGERLADGINAAARPARVRISYREDVTPAMRFVHGARIMQIVSDRAELGRKDGLEYMTEEYSPAGNPA